MVSSTPARTAVCASSVGHRLSAELAATVLDIPQNPLDVDHLGRWHRRARVGPDSRDHRSGRSLGLAGGHPNGRATRGAPSRCPVDLLRRRRTPLSALRHRPTPKRTSPSSKPSIRGRGRCERNICDLKDTGLAKFPSRAVSPSTRCGSPWCSWRATCSAWMKGLCLEGALAKAEPKRLRYTLLHTAGLMVRSARRTTVRIAAGWPWADEIVGASGDYRAGPPPSPDLTAAHWRHPHARPLARTRSETFLGPSDTQAPFGSASDHLVTRPSYPTQTVTQNRRTGSGRSY